MDSNPEKRFDEIVTGRIATDHVVMSEWLQLVLLRMMDKQESHLEILLPYGGNTFLMHHCIEQFNPPAQTEELLIGEKI